MRIRTRIAYLIAEGLAQDFMSFEDFCDEFLRHHFPLRSSQFHIDLKSRLQFITKKRGANDVWQAPRGNAKSTIISLAYILYSICMESERYIVEVSDTHTQACSFLGDVKDELEHNAKLRARFPQACGKGRTWSEESIITRNNIRVDALGMRGKIRGRKFGQHRPTLIIIDDPENDESALSPRQRERTRNWLKKGAVAAGIPRHTNIIIIGTVINADCLVKCLAEGEHDMRGWKSFSYQSIIKWPDRMDLWAEWSTMYHEDQLYTGDDDYEPQAREFYEENREEMEAGAEVLWVWRENLYTLMETRATIGGVAFESEKQNRAINPDQCEFAEDWFEGVMFNDEPWFSDRDAWYCFGGCDPSVGKDSKAGDFCAILSVFWKPKHRFLYVYTDMKRRPNGNIVDRIFELNDVYQYDAFAFEINGFQVMLADTMATKSAEEHINLPLVMVNHTKPKKQRIRRLGTYLEHKFIKFKDQSPDSLAHVKQLKMYPIGDHDDGPDCLEMVIFEINEFNMAANRAA